MNDQNRQTARDYLLSRLPVGRRKEAEAALALLFANADDPAIWFYAVLAESTREAADAQLEAAVAQKNAPFQIEAKLHETIAATIKSEVARQFKAQTEEQRKLLYAIYHKKTWHRLLLSRCVSWVIIPLLLFTGFAYVVFRAPSMSAVSTMLEVPGAYVSIENDRAWVSLPKNSIQIVQSENRPDRTILEIKLPPRGLIEMRQILEGKSDEKAKPTQ